ncbi:MAG: hypothetical protein KM312_11465 [Hydrogenibacillus schlegelii]|uniref:Uncharacterized protein n=1 Tax=Hydrogenibacillus schlegelii TaxID=1484 RepID=A0A947GCK8_HYDSH|nr:hypothetical protein [Hydrogenibacillus schlegelii]
MKSSIVLKENWTHGSNSFNQSKQAFKASKHSFLKKMGHVNIVADSVEEALAVARAMDVWEVVDCAGR